MIRTAYPLLLCLAACGCAAALHAQEAAPPAATPAQPAADDADLDFSGAALAHVRAHARPAAPALQAAARRAIEASAGEADCQVDGERLFEVDLDGDGRAEGVAAWTESGCGGSPGNDYARQLAVLRAQGDDWVPVLTGVSLGTKLVGARRIDAIDGGRLSLRPEGASLSQAETVVVPPLP